jgi:hypothetical protein
MWACSQSSPVMFRNVAIKSVSVQEHKPGHNHDSSEDRAPQINPDTLNVIALWRLTSAPLSAAAGTHRWVWDLRPMPTGERGARGLGVGDGFGDRGGGPAPLPGTYTVKLTVNSKSYTKTLKVKMDPRVKRLAPRHFRAAVLLSLVIGIWIRVTPPLQRGTFSLFRFMVGAISCA